ncbi:MAG: nitric-oxide reductase large subunit [Symbiobacteriia bacterium]
MKLSRGWAQGLIFVTLIALSGLIFGVKSTYDGKPPVPAQVVDPQGKVLYTAKDVQGGQAVFLKYGLMDYGSVFGHGAYLGPDYTAEYLHKTVLVLQDFYGQQLYGKDYAALDQDQQAAAARRVQSDLKTNRYDPATHVLTLSEAEAAAYAKLAPEYKTRLQQGDPDAGMPQGIQESQRTADDQWLSPKPQAEQLTDFFAWSAWAAAANRPGLGYSYTNNWPSDRDAGNVPALPVIIWSAASVGILLLVLGIILFIYRRFKLAGADDDLEGRPLPPLQDVALTPSQVKTGKFFVVVAALFLVQVLVGALSAHYFVDKSFFGLPLQNLVPFNVSRSWHLQLAVFWVATAWLGTGIFIAPLVGGREPKWQGLLVDILFTAVVIVAVGSLVGEWLGIKGYLGKLWYYLGSQGWEYVELGRIWQVLLIVGMLIWLFIVFRALIFKLRNDPDRGSLSHLLLYSAISIPGFYGFGLLFNPNSNFTVADMWRWFIVHQWVEAIFEFFAVVAISFLLVNLGLLKERTATRTTYFTLTLVIGTGLIGVGHHYYYTGAPMIWMALGAVFSAMEVIPLTLLIFEVVEQGDMLRVAGPGYAYRMPLRFLMATSVWNFFGAGVAGFLTNLPIVNYYEHGTYLTPTHGHASMMGTYGMLAIGLMLFAMRTIVKPEAWEEKWLNRSFWLLNIGLLLMVVLDLLPVGFLQLSAVFEKGAWFGRSMAFVNSPAVHTLTWLRMPGDLVFMAGVLYLLAAMAKGFLNLRRATATSEGASEDVTVTAD